MKRFCMLLALLTAVLCAAKPAVWIDIPGTRSKNDTFKVVSALPQEFDMTMTPGANNRSGCGTQMVLTEDKPHHAQQKLYFRARVVGGESVNFHLILTSRQNGKIVTHWGPKFKVSGRNFQTFLFPLDTTFGLNDQDHHIWQIKPWVSIDGVKPGHAVTLAVRDFQIDAAENLGEQSDKPDVVLSCPEHHKVTPKSNALKVFFYIDNNDDRPLSAKGMTDPVPYRGFREYALSTVAQDAVLAASPEEADVIVCSTAAKDPKMAARVAAAVRKGTPLYAAGSVSDPEVAALLPAEVKVLPEHAVPVRRRLQSRDNGFADLSSAAFGVYRELKLRPGARVMLAYDNGAPLLVSGKCGKGSVIYNALGLCAGVLTEKEALDPLLLRMISRLTGRALPELPLKKAAKENGWQEGISANNVGRFGFSLGDGLLCETFSNSLGIANGSGQYEFRSRTNPKLRLSQWHFKPLHGTPAEKEGVREWNRPYGMIGTAEWTAAAEIPEEWRGKTLFFQVTGGIDDTAKVYFNDHFLGEVTKDMPEYWCRPQRYKLPADKIRFGQKNVIRIINENLRESGGFGSCPEIVPAGMKGAKLDVFIDRICALGKGGRVTDRESGGSYRFDTSLAFPGTRWEFPGGKVSFVPGNLARKIGVFRNGKFEFVQPEKVQRLSGKWDKPALLLFPDETGVPLMLVFSRQPDSVSWDFTGGEVSRMTFERKGGVGMILTLWLNGKTPVLVKDGLPDALRKKVDFWIPKAFAFPVDFREFFRIDKAAGKVRIRTTYRYKETPNDWKIAPQHFAAVSPLAYYTKGWLFESSEAEDFQLSTAFGPFAGRDNSDSVNWSLPLPDDGLMLVPGQTGPDSKAELLNSVYADGTRWIGGCRPVETADFVHCFKPGAGNDRCMALHMWLHGMSDVMTAPYALNDANMKNLLERACYRLMLPVEQYGFKSFALWREEPFSGIRFVNHYVSPRPHGSRFVPGKGSNFVVCDGDESTYMVTTVARALAEQHGQREFIRANPRWFRFATQLIFIGDDPVTLTGHCGESGWAASIDMLNCEYAGMLNVARLAEIIGDRDWRDQALYRAARRMVPSLARLPFKHYLIASGQEKFAPATVYGTGFTESGYSYAFTSGKPRALSYHLYDMSQGIPQSLCALYKQYLPQEEREYLKQAFLPCLCNKKGEFVQDHKALNVISRYDGISAEQKQELLEKCLQNQKLMRFLRGDYPGIGLVSNISMAQDQICGKIRILDSRDLDILRFQYDPQRKTAVLQVRAMANPEIIMQCDSELLTPAFARCKDGRFKVPLKPFERKNMEFKLK